MQTALNYSQNPTPQSMAYGLASLGRYGDSYMVHAAEGETVIPAEILLANPQLKADLFRQMQMMGIKDPNRYVVGNTLNSLNPVTGQPEFFFKKLFKAFKAVAPVIFAAIGDRIAPGLGGIIGAAGGTKFQGGSWKDAFGAAATTYGLQTLRGGLQGYGDEAQGGFLGGATAAAQRPFQAGQAMFSDWGGPTNPIAQGFLGPLVTPSGAEQFRALGYGDQFYPQYRTAAEMASRPGELADIKTELYEEFRDQLSPSTPVTSDFTPVVQSDYKFTPPPRKGLGKGVDMKSILPPELTGATTPTPWYQQPLLAEVGLPLAGQLIFGEDDGDGGDEGDARLRGDPAYAEYIRSQGEIPGSEAFYEARRGAGISRGTLTAKQLAVTTGLSEEQAQAFLDRKYGRLAAGGGEITGAGTGTSDSIPARLSDGEFVMTADAVRGAGNGSRDLGAARMYDLMSQFERTV